VHVRACVCARRPIDLPRRPANWTAAKGSTTGQHHWQAVITPLASSTGHHHWSAPLVSTIGRQHWPAPLAPCYKHVGNVDADDDDDHADNGEDDDNEYAADYDYDDDDDANGDDGNRDDELKIHSNMCMHDCARRTVHLPSWTARTGQHHRAAPLPSTNSTGEHHWPAAMV
jgi:hypothetical protein